MSSSDPLFWPVSQEFTDLSHKKFYNPVGRALLPSNRV
jgi:hypothetical protein